MLLMSIRVYFQRKIKSTDIGKMDGLALDQELQKLT